MSEFIDAGTWVELHRIVLSSDERSPHLPDDTRQLPLEMRVKGFLIDAAAIGEEAQIKTVTGRHLHGTLAAANPAYTHSFGPPIAELATIGAEARAILGKEGGDE
jgi:hypothetical protein